MKKEVKKWVFETGHGKELAKAELESVYGDAILDEVEDGWVLNAALADPIKDLNRLGSVVRITEVLKEGPAQMPLNFEDWVVSVMEELLKEHKGKIRFGLSMHPKSEQVLKKILNGAKERLKESLGNVRYVNKDYKNLSSVQAWHEGLLRPGAIELHLFKSAEKWYLTRSLAIQDFEAYSTRDMNRPARDSRNGMFPPKLAQILINLAIGSTPPSRELTVFDPFCGSGTVLQEALLMGLSTFASDLDPDQSESWKKNADWLLQEYLAGWCYDTGRPLPDPKEIGQMSILVQDATTLSEGMPEQPFVIVTESSLGPVLRGEAYPEEIAANQEMLEDLYERFFANLKQRIHTPTTMVFTAPYYRVGKHQHLLPHLPEILARYATVLPLSPEARPSILYERKDQWVGREIWKIIVG